MALLEAPEQYRTTSPKGRRMPPDVLKLLNSGDTAWLLASSALVLLMTPGLAFFYGGMTRSKSVLNMLMMNFATIGIVSVLWVLYGYSLAFAKDVGNHGFIGGVRGGGGEGEPGSWGRPGAGLG